MSAAGQQWPRCTICGETRNHRHSCNDDWHRYNPAWNSACPECRSATRYSGGLHHCTKCAYAFTGRRPPRQVHRP